MRRVLAQSGAPRSLGEARADFAPGPLSGGFCLREPALGSEPAPPSRARGHSGSRPRPKLGLGGDGESEAASELRGKAPATARRDAPVFCVAMSYVVLLAMLLALLDLLLADDLRRPVGDGTGGILALGAAPHLRRVSAQPGALGGEARADYAPGPPPGGY